MTYEISPLQYSEIDENTLLRYTAFSQSESSYIKCFYPGGYTDKTYAFWRRNAEKHINDPDHHFLLIRDPSTKEVLGAAEWKIQREPKTIETILEEDERGRQERASAAPVEGVNYVAIDAFREIQAECHRELLQGQPHVYLSVLAIYPQHQRRGIGNAAMKWGLDKADELGLPAYLEASQAGKGLYERCGFEVVKVFPFDARKFGNERSMEHYCMIRQPRKADVA